MVDEILLPLVGVGLLPVGGEGAQPLLVPPAAVAGLGQGALVGDAAVRTAACNQTIHINKCTTFLLYCIII